MGSLASLAGIQINQIETSDTYLSPYLYTKIGLGEIPDPEILGNDIYPVETLLVRHIDCGDWIIKDDGTKVQVL